MVIMMVIGLLFTFAYPLIVDRRLSGINAVKLSIRAGIANFWRLLGMILVTMVLNFVGVLFCYVGAFLVMPMSFAAIAMAYEQVFGLGRGGAKRAAPPPSFV